MPGFAKFGSLNASGFNPKFVCNGLWYSYQFPYIFCNLHENYIVIFYISETKDNLLK